MKLVILGDTHFGVRSDNLAFHNYFAKFYRDVFFPYLESNDIGAVIQTGDLFDRRKFINYNTFHLSKTYFFNWFAQKNRPKLYTYLGNHDLFYRNAIQVNSHELLLADYVKSGFVEICVEPKTFEFDGVNVDLIPWICRDNEAKIKHFMQQSKSQICFGHFEIAGFEMERGHVCVDGMARSDLDKYEVVISGHFHHKSTDGHITYVGAPCEHTWADYDDVRGFHVFDTQTRNLDFIENPYRIHHKIIYDDAIDTLEQIQERDFSSYTGTILKVLVQNKNNPFMFDLFMDQLSKSNPLDISIVEDFTDTHVNDKDVAESMDDTITLIGKAVDGIETNLDKEKMKGYMRDIYQEALMIESNKGIIQ